MAARKKKAEDDSKQGASRTAFGHDIVTSYDGEGAWSVKIFYEEAHRQTLVGLRYEGDARWAGEDWAHLNRVLVPDAKLVGRDFYPIVYGEKGVEVARLSCRATEFEAVDYATQYIEQLRIVDREKVRKKQERRAEWILKMEEFDAIEANLEKKIADFKEALKLAQEQRLEWIEGSRNPQIEFNFVFDRKRARQVDIEDAGGLPAKQHPASPEAVLLGDLLDDASKAAAEKAKSEADATKPDEKTKRGGKKPPPRPEDEQPSGEAHP
jgi:hypothetical protein